MYGSNLVLPRGGITTYQQAVDRFNSITPIRGRSTDTRPVAQRRNDNFTIRQLPKDGAIAIRLYHTDIIVYRPDGTIELEPYASRLTDDAVRHILRGAVTPSYTNPIGPVLWVAAEQKCYRIPDFAVLGPDLTLVAGSKPFTQYSLDKRNGAAALRQSGYKTFALWLKTQLKLGVDPRQGGRWSSGGHYSGEFIRSLSDPTRYLDLAKDMSGYVHVNRQLASLRTAIHKYAGTVVETEVPYVTNWRELDRIRASQRTWAGY